MGQDFNEKNILVTGITSGIGLHTASCLLEKGANVLGIGRDASKIDSLIQKYQKNLSFVVHDFNEEVDFEPSINEFVISYGKLNGFLNCAGIEETLPISMYNPSKLRRVFNVNFNMPFEILRLLSKKKFGSDAASFVFLSSVMSELGQPGKTAYCSSKSAILGMVKAAALELSARRIRVNAVSPGVVNTPMTQNLFSQITEENKQKITEMHPLGLGSTKDVIPLLLFLLSDDSSWITGQNLIVDGGYSVQ